MADYSYTQLGITTTTLVSYGVTTTQFLVQSESTTPFTTTATNGTISVGTINILSNNQTRDYSTAKRPNVGLLYPRRVKY